MINSDTNYITTPQNHQQISHTFQILHAYQRVSGAGIYYWPGVPLSVRTSTLQCYPSDWMHIAKPSENRQGHNLWFSLDNLHPDQHCFMDLNLDFHSLQGTFSSSSLAANFINRFISKDIQLTIRRDPTTLFFLDLVCHYHILKLQFTLQFLFPWTLLSRKIDEHLWAKRQKLSISRWRHVKLI